MTRHLRLRPGRRQVSIEVPQLVVQALLDRGIDRGNLLRFSLPPAGPARRYHGQQYDTGAGETYSGWFGLWQYLDRRQNSFEDTMRTA